MHINAPAYIMYVFVPTSTHCNLHCVVVFVSGVYCFIIMMCVCVRVRELCSKDVHTFCFAIAVCDHICLDASSSPLMYFLTAVPVLVRS